MSPANPKRLPQNVDGDFYTTGSMIPSGPDSPEKMIWCGDCLACEAPERAAPDLLAKLSKANTNTYFVRQPESEVEIDSACRALTSCCVSALRYAGKDCSIIEKLNNNPEYCDYVISPDGKLVGTLDAAGELLPIAEQMTASINGWVRHACSKSDSETA